MTPDHPQGQLDVGSLARWLDSLDNGNGDGPLSVSPLAGGSQNDLFTIQRGDRRLVLRAPPVHASLERAKRMMREYQLVRSLAPTDVPHARAVGATDDPNVLGRPFYVMEYVEGWSPLPRAAWPPPFDADLDQRAQLAFELVDGAARLARVDWRALGLEEFGRPEGFHERQVDRWLSFLAQYQFRDLPGLEFAAEWLRQHRPESFRPGIMHGDYQFANVIYRPEAPARLAAIVDWEMATIGDPLLDLGWSLIAWPPEGDDMPLARHLDFEGMPSREDLLERYATISGLALDHIDYYVVLARFKLAIVLEQTVARVITVPGRDEGVAHFEPLVLELMRKASELAHSRA
jgi:aminoglycoside phosphotransferase (APT) family kinase protein